MASRGESFVAYYYAWDTSASTPKTGDVANHTLRLVKNGGTPTAPTNSAAEIDATNMPGWYKVTLTAAETNSVSLLLTGKSSTANVVLWGMAITTEIGAVRVGTAQDGGGLSITLDSGASSTDQFYTGQRVLVMDGAGAGQDRLIVDYIGSTKVATVHAGWLANPNSTSVFAILPDSRVSVATWTDTHPVGLATGPLNGPAVNANVSSIRGSSLSAPVSGGNYATAFRDLFGQSSTDVDGNIANAVWANANGVIVAEGATRFLTMIELDTAVYRYTANALELAPGGGGSDPLDSEVPGDYAQGTAGFALGRIGSGQITTTSPVSQSGDVEVVKGDAYTVALGRALSWTDVSAGWPDLSEAVSILLESDDGRLSVEGEVTSSTTPQSVRVELSGDNTAVFTAGDYDFRVVATFAGTGATAGETDRATLVRGILTCVDSEDA